MTGKPDGDGRRRGPLRLLDAGSAQAGTGSQVCG
jgi:hypothetical protein